MIQPDSAPISVSLSVASEPYQGRLPEALLQRGMLRRVLRFGPDVEVLDPDHAGSLKVVRRFRAHKFINRLLWAAWRRLPGTRDSHLPKVGSCWLADQWASRHVPPSSLFHGLTCLSLACFETARRLGALTVLESPTPHLQDWQDRVMAECNRFGINPRDCSAVLPGALIRRAQREYELCDRIIVLSSAARRSFETFGYVHKTLVVCPGVDHAFFRPAVGLKSPRPFRVCYVGRVELAKGIGYLLEAWKRLSLPRAELLVVGEVQPEMFSLLKTCAGSSVRPAGRLQPVEVAECYRQSTLFVLPSVNEGFGLVLLEAMASGLPVVATEESGAEDCLTEGEDGLVVPARNVDALSETILWCFQHRDEIAAMGQAARAKVEQQFTLSHYEERLISLYRSQIGTGKVKDTGADPVLTKNSRFEQLV